MDEGALVALADVVLARLGERCARSGVTRSMETVGGARLRRRRRRRRGQTGVARETEKEVEEKTQAKKWLYPRRKAEEIKNSNSFDN